MPKKTTARKREVLTVAVARGSNHSALTDYAVMVVAYQRCPQVEDRLNNEVQNSICLKLKAKKLPTFRL